MAEVTTARPVAALLATTALIGCTTPPAASPALAGTRWQLLAIESMADEQPTLRPDEPSRYTLAFGGDGRAELRLDCNRGSAPWQAQPALDGGTSGSLQFGPLAATRAMCPASSVAPRLERAIPYVRSYLLKDGRLHLSLLADGGILSWAPAP